MMRYWALVGGSNIVLITEWVPTIAVLLSAAFTVGFQFRTIKGLVSAVNTLKTEGTASRKEFSDKITSMGDDFAECMKEMRETVNSSSGDIWKAINGVREITNTTQIKMTDFYGLENERHTKQDVMFDEIRGEMKRHGREINETKVWEAGAAQRLNLPQGRKQTES